MFQNKFDILRSSGPLGYDELMTLDLAGDYPETPYDLITVNNRFMLCLYGGAIKDNQIAAAFAKQRHLFAAELINLNPFEKSTQSLTDDIKKAKQEKRHIVSCEILDIDYGDTTCTVNVRQVTNSAAEQTIRYYLTQENGLWKILAWNYQNTE